MSDPKHLLSSRVRFHDNRYKNFAPCSWQDSLQLFDEIPWEQELVAMASDTMANSKTPLLAPRMTVKNHYDGVLHITPHEGELLTIRYTQVTKKKLLGLIPYKKVRNITATKRHRSDLNHLYKHFSHGDAEEIFSFLSSKH
jgi:hypothetical protein